MSPGRPRGLELLGVLWLRDVTPEDWPALSSNPELAWALPEPAPRPLAELAAERRRLAENVPPLESTFLGPDAQPGHIGHRLRELAACDAGVGDRARAASLVARLAAWVPALTWSLRRIAPPPLYSALGEMTLDAVLSRLETLDRDASVPLATAIGRDEGTPADAGRGLLDARLCGCHISGQELARIAQWLAIPRVAGSRAQLLQHLATAAAAAGIADRLLIALRDLLDDARLDYDGLASAYPAWEPFRAAWSTRLDRGLAAVEALGRALAGGGA